MHTTLTLVAGRVSFRPVKNGGGMHHTYVNVCVVWWRYWLTYSLTLGGWQMMPFVQCMQNWMFACVLLTYHELHSRSRLLPRAVCVECI